jgi:hypothetical protein
VPDLFALAEAILACDKPFICRRTLRQLESGELSVTDAIRMLRAGHGCARSAQQADESVDAALR